MNNSNHDVLPLEKSGDDKTKGVITIADFMLNKVNSQRLPKSKKVKVLNFPGATSTDIVNKMNYILIDKPQVLIAHSGTSNLTNDMNLLNNVKKNSQ